jgi:hypothetical protein
VERHLVLARPVAVHHPDVASRAHRGDALRPRSGWLLDVQCASWAPNGKGSIVFSAFEETGDVVPTICRVAANGLTPPTAVASAGSDPDWGTRARLDHGESVCEPEALPPVELEAATRMR